MSRMSAGFGFVWSKWNHGASARRVIFLAKEILSNEDHMSYWDFAEKISQDNKDLNENSVFIII